MIRMKLNRDLRILGLLPTFYDSRTNLARDMLDELRVVGDHHVFNSIVRNTVKLGEAPLAGRPITIVRRQLRRGPHVPRSRSGGDRSWPDLTSAPPPLVACPRIASSRPRSSACCRPRRRRPQRPASASSRSTASSRTRTSRGWSSTRTRCTSSRRRSASTASSSRSSSGRSARTATSSSPASAAGAPPSEAGLATIPALVEELDDDTALEIAIIENLQREDLSPLEEATMYDRMIREHGYSIRKLAEKLGKDKGYVENRLRLADAPEEIRELVSLRKDTLSHAYELLKVHDAKKRRRLAAQVASGELSLVKLRERIEGRRSDPPATSRTAREPVETDGRRRRRQRPPRPGGGRLDRDRPRLDEPPRRLARPGPPPARRRGRGAGRRPARAGRRRARSRRSTGRTSPST